MHLPEIDKYAHLDSPLHRWDARVKLVCLVVLLLAVVLAPSCPTALAGLGVAVLLVVYSRIPFSFVFVHLRWVLTFCLFLLIMLALTAGGEPLWEVGRLRVSAVGVRLAGLICVRATAAALLVFPMLGTTPLHVTLKALRRLRVPAAAVQILAFSYRYVFVIFEELRRMLSAARSRGHGRAGLRRRLANTGSMMAMLLVRSLDRSARVHRAMLARGYRGDVAALGSFHVGPVDLAKGAVVMAMAIALFLGGALA